MEFLRTKCPDTPNLYTSSTNARMQQFFSLPCIKSMNKKNLEKLYVQNLKNIEC